MRKNFDAQEFVRLLFLSLQSDAGYSSMENGRGLYKKSFNAFSVIEVYLVSPCEADRFCTAISDSIREDTHGTVNRSVYRTIIVVPIEYGSDIIEAAACRSTDSEAPTNKAFINTGVNTEIKDYYLSRLGRLQDEYDKRGILSELIFIEPEINSFTLAGRHKISDKRIGVIIQKTLDINSEGAGEHAIREKKRQLIRQRESTGKIYEKRRINPLLLLVLINTAIFFLGVCFEITKGYDPFIRFGIQDNDLIMRGEIWRLFTPMFLHADAAHLIGNMLMLIYLGRVALDYYTVREFLSIYLLSGVTGNILSLCFTDYLSLGASGAVMGLGGMLIYRMFFGKYSKAFRQAGNYAVFAVMIVFNLFYGIFAVNSNINNFGHFGGFFGGFAVSAVIDALRRRRENHGREV